MKGFKKLSETKGQYLLSKDFILNGTVWYGQIQNEDGENLGCYLFRRKS